MDKLIFNEETHEYFLGDKKLPSVTTIIKNAGLIDTTFFKPTDSDRGTAVHKMTELIDKKLEYSLPEELQGYAEAYYKFLNDYIPVWLSIEHRVYDAVYGYAGTLDRASGVAIWDIKSGAPCNWHGIQLAAYSYAYNPFVNYKRYGLYLNKDGCYSIVEYNNKKDIEIFKAALTLWRYKNG